ncbi:MAG TPA: efflux RND transporter periplasmic adaptor subunit [Polyangiales bacterium]
MSQRAKYILWSALALAGCDHQANASEPRPAYRVEHGLVNIERKGPLTFETAAVKQGEPLPLPKMTARISTVEALTSPSFAPLSGRVVESRVHLGDHVEKGQPLVLVRTGDLALLQRDRRSAELAVSTRQAVVERMRALVESRAGSEHDLLIAESELAESKLADKAAKARLSSLQIAQDKKDETAYWVLASKSGTVVQLDAAPGSVVGPERGLPIVTIADLAEVLAVADVPQQDAIELHRGAQARVFASGLAGEAVEGTVEVVSEVVDPERQTVPVRVRVDNRARKLRPNAYVDMTFEAQASRNAVLVPSVAVVRDGASAVVFVEVGHGSFARRAVVVGRRSHDEVEIVHGLSLGERVVTTGALLLVNALDVGA